MSCFFLGPCVGVLKFCMQVRGANDERDALKYTYGKIVIAGV